MLCFVCGKRLFDSNCFAVYGFDGKRFKFCIFGITVTEQTVGVEYFSLCGLNKSNPVNSADFTLVPILGINILLYRLPFRIVCQVVGNIRMNYCYIAPVLKCSCTVRKQATENKR